MFYRSSSQIFWLQDFFILLKIIVALKSFIYTVKFINILYWKLKLRNVLNIYLLQVTITNTLSVNTNKISYLKKTISQIKKSN